MISFRTLYEATNQIILSDDMKKYAEEAYQKTKDWLKLMKFEGHSTEEIFKHLQNETVNLFKRYIHHDLYENMHKITFTITAKPEQMLVRFDGGFDSGNMDKIILYFVSPKQIANFSEESMKKDFLMRVCHETIHAVDPINNDYVIRKELDVDGKMIKQNVNGNYKNYIMLPWEIKANLSTMAEFAVEYLISKNMDYNKIVKEIENWQPKLSHPDFQKEKDYYEDEKSWKQYKTFMKRVLDLKLKGDQK